MDNSLVITIMAAGEGKRMKSVIPKVLHLCKGIPMLVNIINESLKVSNKIVVITGKFDELIKLTVRKYINNTEYNKIFFVQQKNPCGTADAIKSSLHIYEKNEKVIILNGDMPLISSSIIERFYKETTQNSLIVCNLENPFGYGRIICNKNNEIMKIVEEKDCSIEEKNIKMVNTGLYKFDAEILINFIPLIKNNNKQQEYYLTDIIELLKRENIMITTFLLQKEEQKYIKGVNTPEELLEAENI